MNRVEVAIILILNSPTPKETQKCLQEMQPQKTPLNRAEKLAHLQQANAKQAPKCWRVLFHSAPKNKENSMNSIFHIALAFGLGLIMGGLITLISCLRLYFGCREKVQEIQNYANELENEIIYLERQIDLEQRIYNSLEKNLSAKFSRPDTT